MSYRFRAGVQYGDFEGTAAADDADKNDMADYLREQGLIGDNEFVIGIELSVLYPEVVYVRCITFDMTGYESVPDAVAAHGGNLPVKAFRIDLTLEQFFHRFKRFSVFLTSDNLNLTDREFDVTNE